MLSLVLQESTEEIHKQAEKKMIAQLRQIRSTEDYVRFLNGMYGFYQPMEDHIAAELPPSVFPDMDKHKRAANILQDMQDLGLPLPFPDICRDLPRIDSFESALGALYVLEGSTLGGKVIANLLSRQLNLEKGLSFFNAYGMETGAMWISFKAFLDRPFSDNQKKEILDAALNTFQKFKNWIDQHELHSQPQL